jgi:hypothetical protein
MSLFVIPRSRVKTTSLLYPVASCTKDAMSLSLTGLESVPPLTVAGEPER